MEYPEMREVVPCRENEQAGKQRQTGPEPVFLRPRWQRPATNRLERR